MERLFLIKPMKIELDLTPEQAEKVKKMLAVEKKEWVKKGEDYYFLRGERVGTISGWPNEEVDEEILKRANVYRTPESAEQAEHQRLALGAIHQYVRDNWVRMAGFNGYVPDWNDGRDKWQIQGWDFHENFPVFIPILPSDLSSHGLVFDTEEDLQKVIENCKAELKDLLKVDYSIIR